MIRNIKIILCIMAAIITTGACQKEEMEDTQKQDKEQVSFLMAPKSGIETGTDYVPMGGTRADSKKAYITNQYNYVIAKRIDSNRLMVEEVGKTVIDKTKAKNVAIPVGEDGQKYINLIVELRPGDYEIFMFTGDINIVWNDAIKKGDILDETEKPVKALEYKTIAFWGGKMSKSILEEIFYVREKIKVEKTTDLHTPNPNTFKLGLERRVSKFRVLLNNMQTPTGEDFQTIINHESLPWGIYMTIKRTGGKKFASGLDIWGNLWYDDSHDIEQLTYATVTRDEPLISPKTTGKYYISTRYKSLLYAPYMLADPNEEIEIETVRLECESQLSMSGSITCISEDKLTFKLKNNTIDGYSLRLTDNLDGDGNVIIEPVRDSGGKLEKVAELFEGNYEFI